MCFQCSILHKKMGGNLSSMAFRIKLINKIIEKYGVDTETYRRGGRPSNIDNPFRLVERHFPSYVPATITGISPANKYVFTNSQDSLNHVCGLQAMVCFEIKHMLYRRSQHQLKQLKDTE